MCAQATAAHGHLVIQMLGPPAIVWEGQSFPIARRQVRALLYRLAADRHFVARDLLCALFWPDATTDVAQANLSRLVYLLKQALPDPELLLRREEQIGLDPERTWADTRALAEVLDRPLAEPDALRAAVALYRGPFLDGFSCPDAAEFDLWITRQRHAWEQRYLALLGRLLDLEEQQGDLAAAVRWARRCLEIDELAEPVHRRLILLYAALDDREAAARQFERCVVALERELGVAPLPETRAAYEAALSGRRSRPAPRAVSSWHLWPALAAPFVGREAALEQLRRAYAHARRGRGAAMFIVGEPGIGKTRLLQEFTASLPADARILAVAGREMAQDVPYLALAEGLRRVLPAVDWAGLPVSRGLLAELTVILPDLRDRCPGLPARQDAPAAGPTRLFLALDDLLAALAHAQPPLVFCLDDLHLLDESTRGWLTGWLAGLRHLPALFLATYRPEEAAAAVPLHRAAAHGCPVTELALAGLERAAVREIVRYALGEAAHDPALDEHLHQLTGGNPFFLLELLRHLAENPAPAAAAPDELSFPATIQDAVRRRLDRLPAAARHALEAASVLGTPFSPEVLAITAAYHQGRLDDPAAPAVQAADDLTLVVELEHPCSFFPHLIAHPVARPVPSHRLEMAGEGWWKPDLLVTNGPFRLREWIPDVRAALVRSPTYRGDWPGNAEEVVLHLGLDRERKQAKWRRYQEGGLDVFTLRWGLAPEEMARIQQEDAGELISAANFFVHFLGFNTRRAAFADARVRHAFARAVDRRTVIHLLGGDLAPARGGMIPPGMPGHTAELAPGYDPLQARSLLAAAGYPDGRGFPPVRLLAFPGVEAAAEYLQLAWRRILRVEVGLEALPWEAYQQRLRCGPWPDLFLAGWVADYPDPDSLLRVCAIPERTGWRNAAYVALLERAARSRDQEERLRLYREADALLMQDLPIFPLAYSCWSLLLKPRVRHFPFSPLKWWYWTDVVLEAM